MRWTDTVLFRLVVQELRSRDNPTGFGADVFPWKEISRFFAFAAGVVLLQAVVGSDPAGSIATALLGWAGLANVRGTARPAMEARQRTINDSMVGRDYPAGSFVFYLRPFKGDGRRPVTTQKVSGMVSVVFGLEADFEFMLSHALRWTFPVIGLGRSDNSKGAAHRIVENDVWQEEVMRLADLSAAIVCVPGATEGTMWELAYLRSRVDLLKKTVFFMPPRLGMRIQRIIPEMLFGRTQRTWDDVQRRCAAFNLHLPDYQSRGGVFVIEDDGGAHEVFDICGFDPARIETVCAAVVVRPKMEASAFRNDLSYVGRPQTLVARIGEAVLSAQVLTVAIWAGLGGILLVCLATLWQGLTRQ